ncbi:MAG: histidinol-phosphate transaminase [Terriglobales bacterium]
MGRFDELVPEHIRKLAGYTPGKPLKQAERESGITCTKMASNENPFGPSPRAIAAMHEAAPLVHLYPDNDATELRALIAGRFSMRPEHVLITGGSTQFLNIIVHSLLAPGLNAVTSERSFIVYPIATQAAGGTLKQVPMRGDTFDLDAILDAIDDKTRVVFIANPNNPTGTLLDPQAISRFLDCVPEHVLVVLDEAYYEFAEYFARRRGVDYTHSLEFVRQERNVVVLRTFSKAQGLAGLRVGYGFGPAELIQYFARERTAFSISTLAEAAAIAALGDEEHIRKTAENNAAGAAWMTRKLSEMGLRVVPTWANFLFVEIGEDAPLVARRMQQEGVIVRPMTGVWGAPHAIRISIGTPEQNQQCVSVLKRVMEHAVVL